MYHLLSQNQALEGCRPGRLQVTISTYFRLRLSLLNLRGLSLDGLMILIKDKMANSYRTTVKNMNGGNTLNKTIHWAYGVNNTSI